MNLKLEIEFSKAEILQEVDGLKKQIDNMRPLPADVEGRVMQKLRLDWNYNSNAIEGNKLSYGETVAFLMEGITAKGKPLKDHLDIRGHNEAILLLSSLVKESRTISESDIRSLHEMILVEPYEVKAQTAEGLPTTKKITLGEYKKLPNHVKTATGELHYYTTPEETPVKMQELMEWYNEAINNEEIHPVVVAALFHHKFVAIHPFDDGNGRLSRILMNLILMQTNYPPVIVKMDDRQNYYSLLSRADANDNWTFVEYIAERLQSSLQLYLKAANGEDINDDDDIDKEIALFRIDLQAKVTPKKKASKDDIHKTILEVIIPFIEKLSKKLKVFSEFFEKVTLTVDEPDYPLKNSIDQNIDNIDHDLFATITNRILFDKHIKSISLDIKLINFKNPDNVFNVTDVINFSFDDQEYIIDNNTIDWEIYKSYNEKLSVADQNFIIKNIINDIKEIINDNFKE